MRWMACLVGMPLTCSARHGPRRATNLLCKARAGAVRWMACLWGHATGLARWCGGTHACAQMHAQGHAQACTHGLRAVSSLHARPLRVMV
ncbi:hypothetical protein I3760_05G078900 [Carya illinoinensis]|nr:hypothetical protein I3760_05G078900 [Carya illinoinensis]